MCIIIAYETQCVYSLDKIVNNAFSPEMGYLMVYLTTNKIPSESTNGKTLFSTQIQAGRHYIWSNIQTDLILDLSNIATLCMCHCQLTSG